MPSGLCYFFNNTSEGFEYKIIQVHRSVKNCYFEPDLRAESEMDLRDLTLC